MNRLTDFIAQIASGNNVGAKETFNELVSEKTSLSLENRKQEIASTIFQAESIISMDEEKTPIKTSNFGAGRSVTLFKHAKGEHSIERNDGKVLHHGTEASAKKLWGELYEEISMDEDVDQIDEVSPGLLARAAQSASDSDGRHDPEEYADYAKKKFGSKIGKQIGDIGNTSRVRAPGYDRLAEPYRSNRSTNKNMVTKAGQLTKNAQRGLKTDLTTDSKRKITTGLNNSYEPEGNQIDEISKRLKADYIKAASHDIATKGAMTRHYGELSARQEKANRAATAHLTPDGRGYPSGGPRAGAGDARDNDKMADKIFAKSWKRREFMAKAADQLASESVELEPGKGSHLNIGGARVKNDRESVLAHVKKTFPNASDIEKKDGYSWGPKK